jgi:hypothetical protein
VRMSAAAASRFFPGVHTPCAHAGFGLPRRSMRRPPTAVPMPILPPGTIIGPSPINSMLCPPSGARDRARQVGHRAGRVRRSRCALAGGLIAGLIRSRHREGSGGLAAYHGGAAVGSERRAAERRGGGVRGGGGEGPPAGQRQLAAGADSAAGGGSPTHHSSSRRPAGQRGCGWR